MTLTALAATGCYAPELRDCIVACTATDECAPDQICGTDGRCAAPELAGRCASMPGPGAVDAAIDARIPVDATPAIDAMPVDAPPAAGQLKIKIGGRGHVVVNGDVALGCSDSAPGDQCTFTLASGAVTLRAFPALDHRFERWMGACTSTNDTCVTTVQPGPPATVEARFKRDHSEDDDDE